MRLLLDTHTFIWSISDPMRLSEKVREELQDPEHTVILSVASIWEMQIKHQLGKLTVGNTSVREAVELAQTQAGLHVIPIEPAHVYALDHLPSIHRDPFDRMLVAQAIVESLTLVTTDSVVRSYPAQTLW